MEKQHNKTLIGEFRYMDYFNNLKLIADVNIRTMERNQTTNQQPGPEQPLHFLPHRSSLSSAKPVLFNSAYMKSKMNNFRHAAFIFIAASCLYACSSSKRGCPSNGKNVGAEKLLSGEKVPKAKKFKA
jgi:hypothetical protein